MFGKKKKKEVEVVDEPKPPATQMQIKFDYKQAFDLRTKVGIDMPSLMKCVNDVVRDLGEKASPLHRRYILVAGMERYLAELRVRQRQVKSQ